MAANLRHPRQMWRNFTKLTKGDIHNVIKQSQRNYVCVNALRSKDRMMTFLARSRNSRFLPSQNVLLPIRGKKTSIKVVFMCTPLLISERLIEENALYVMRRFVLNTCRCS